MEIGKKVPARRNCGRVIKLAIEGTALSFLAIPETTNPNPRNTDRAITDRTIILRNVITPFTRVNPKNKFPISIIITALNIENISLLRDSPIRIKLLLTGVAKNLLMTSVCLRLIKMNAVPKTPALSSEKPSCPGRIKSIVLNFLPSTTSSLISVTGIPDLFRAVFCFEITSFSIILNMLPLSGDALVVLRITVILPLSFF